MTYAPEYGKVLCDRSIRCRVGVSGVPLSASQQARTTDDTDADLAGARSTLQLQGRATRQVSPWS
jgi:hypothetical protein